METKQPQVTYYSASGDGDTFSISFYIGHGGSEYVWNWAGWIWYYEQQWFIIDNNGGKVYDKDIFQYMGCRNTHFVLWSCHQGETIGGTYWPGTLYGMPYAWLYTTSLSSYGYEHPGNGEYVFIGFQGVALLLTYDGLGADDAGYRFLRYFYAMALLYGYYYSINLALDHAETLTHQYTVFSALLSYWFLYSIHRYYVLE